MPTNGSRITKANHAHFRALADASRARKRAQQAEAIALAESLLKSDPNAQGVSANLVRQAAMIDRLIVEQLGKGDSPAKLEKWLRCQSIILSQIAKAREMQPKPGERARARMLEPLKAMAERDPAVVMAALRPMLEPKPAQSRSQIEPVQASPAPAQPVQVEPAQAESEPVLNQPSDPADLFG